PGPGSLPAPAVDMPGRVRADGRGVQTAPAALPVWAATPAPDGPPAAPGPMPVLPELPPAAPGGRGPVVRDAVMQALGDSALIGLAASSTATALSPAGPAPAAMPPGLGGGAEIVRAVAPQIAAAIGSGPGAGRIELRLDPPELGRVEISLEIIDQSLRATLAAERPATNELLRRHGEMLLTQLQQAGFTEIDLQFSDNRARDRGSAQPGVTPRLASAGDSGASPHDDNGDRPAGPVGRRATEGLDLRL
ncbi:MAG: flagellar hook-length control protein FliK, partial [Alphaproteobacteria bacterium]